MLYGHTVLTECGPASKIFQNCEQSFDKFLHLNQKKFMKQKRRQIDHRIAFKSGLNIFSRLFCLQFRRNKPKEGAAHRMCASHPERIYITLNRTGCSILHHFFSSL